MQAEAAVRESETLFRSLGLQIVDSLSRQLGGEGVFTSEGGTRFRLALRI